MRKISNNTMIEACIIAAHRAVDAEFENVRVSKTSLIDAITRNLTGLKLVDGGASDDIKEGDVVRLKAGGPRMTVAKVLKTSKSVELMWFEGSLLQIAPAVPIVAVTLILSGKNIEVVAAQTDSAKS